MSKENVVNQVKIWITPSIIGILGMFIWRDLSELRTDVKTLLAQNAENQIRLNSLDKQVDEMNQKIWQYHGAKTASVPVEKPATLVAIKEDYDDITPKYKPYAQKHI